MEKKRAGFFSCKSCDYYTSRLFNLNRHFLTPKHLMINNDNKKVQKRVTQNDTDVENIFVPPNDVIVTKKTSKKRAKNEQKTSKNEQKRATQNDTDVENIFVPPNDDIVTKKTSTKRAKTSKNEQKRANHNDTENENIIITPNDDIVTKKTSKNEQKRANHNDTENENIIITPNDDIVTKKTSTKRVKTSKNEQKRVKTSKNEQEKIPKKFVCPTCSKSFVYHSGLSRHKQKCSLKNQNLIDTIETTINNKNQELLEIIDSKITDVKNMTVNNQFNINIFLNEDCKNAMNMCDFIENIRLTLEDLQYTKENGNIIGISNILNKNLLELPETVRPIHCSDKNKLDFYIKSKNTWKKDDAGLFNKDIAVLTQKQIKIVEEWEKKNPDWKDEDHKREEYFEIINTICSPIDEVKDINKIKQSIVENIVIE